MSADELLENPWNHRRHGRAQQKVVSASLDELGIVKSILVNRTTGHIVDGHDRIRDAQSRGEGTLVDVEYVDLSEEEEKKALAILDAAVGLATVDAEALDRLLEEVQTDSVELDNYLEALHAEIESELDRKRKAKPKPDAAPKIEQAAELMARWGTAVGDVWELGDHRLICGDVRDADVVARLLDGRRPLLMTTDPPYGVEYDPTWRNEAGVSQTKRTGAVANDDQASWARAWRHFPGDVAYVWHAGAYATEVDLSLRSVGFAVHAQIIWVKPRFAMSRGHYHWRHEPCFFVVRKGSKAHWQGGRRQQTVWADIVDSYAKEQLFAGQVDHETVLAFPADWTTVWEIKPSGAADKPTEHGTQKPVECFARAIRNHDSGLVYDPFAGSGSSLIACIQEGRQALLGELDPKYVAVILQRYVDATGETPAKVK